MVMKDKQVVLFDLDGTIIDPKVGITNSFRYAFEKYGIVVDQATLETFIGPPLVDTLENYDLDASEAIDHFRTYFKKNGIKEFTVYPHVEEVLIKLKENNFKLAVATSKPTVYAVDILKEVKLDQYFDFIEGSFLDNTRTDKNEIIEAVLDQFNMPLETIVMIGDRKHDIIGAQKQGVSSIGVTYGYGTLKELEDIQADIIVESPLDILKVLCSEV